MIRRNIKWCSAVNCTQGASWRTATPVFEKKAVTDTITHVDRAFMQKSRFQLLNSGYIALYPSARRLWGLRWHPEQQSMLSRCQLNMLSGTCWQISAHDMNAIEYVKAGLCAMN
jgi:hypothetical protein